MTTIALLGAAGRTGQLVISQGKARGVTFKTLARDPSKLSGAGIEVVKGDVREAEPLGALFAGTDAVISALGSAGMTIGGLQSAAMAGIVAAMHGAGVKRYVALTSGAALLPGERPAGMNALALGVMGLLFKAYVADKKAEVAALVESDLDWTLLRVPGQLVDGEGRGLTIGLDAPRGMPKSAQRHAVATALLDAVLDKKWIRQGPWAPGAA